MSPLLRKVQPARAGNIRSILCCIIAGILLALSL